jgi:Astacin (Peptidase family M12A)
LLFNLLNCTDTKADEKATTSGNEDAAASEHEVLVGDMILSDDQMNYLYSVDNTSRLGLSSPFLRWPSAVVYYDVDKSVDRKGREVVIAAMNYIQNVSCVQFKVKDETTEHHVLIKSGKACSSKVGMRRGSPQTMIIDGNLCSKGSVVHELLHCLGFLHMHTANDRDNYITINWNNIRDDAKVNFKQFVASVSMFHTEYDYDSITHYSSNAFAKDKKTPTIIAKKLAPIMGQRKGRRRMR